MTLVLTCLTDDYIVQVSDRRLTQIDESGKAIKIASEDSNKALFLDHKWIIGFTGLAKLAGKRADLWMAEELSQISELPLRVRLDHIATRLAGAVKWAPRNARRVAFVGAGYARVNGGPILATAFHITNYLDAKGKPGPMTSDCLVRVKPLVRRHDFFIAEAGALMFEGHRRELNQIVRSARKRRAGPIEVARILAESVWRVAIHNNGVGDRLMICLLPRKSVERVAAGGEAFVSGGLQMNADEASFFYLGPETADMVQFGPTVVSRGTMFSDMRMSFGTAEKPAQPSPELAAIHFQGAGGARTPDDARCPCGSGKTYKGCHNQT